METYCGYCGRKFDNPDVYVNCDEQQADNSTPRYHRACFLYERRLATLTARLVKAEAAVKALRELVDQQAEDEGLWFIANTCAEAYLQQELRRLHSMIEDIHVEP